jgi:hypothetical protein
MSVAQATKVVELWLTDRREMSEDKVVGNIGYRSLVNCMLLPVCVTNVVIGRRRCQCVRNNASDVKTLRFAFDANREMKPLAVTAKPFLLFKSAC